MRGRKEGLIVRDAHYPGRAPIDAYGNSGFRFADMSHVGSVLCVPSGIYGWSPVSADELDQSAFETVFAESSNIEVLLIGTGPALVRIKPELRDMFRSKGIMADSMSTGAAVRTFNVLLAENRAVAACLLAVD
ncbi:MAG: MTH938/NDUFAF3 family protein [Stappiaceae bacterium]